MGLDVTVGTLKRVPCLTSDMQPYDVREILWDNSGGHDWYEWLQDIGYYVPYEERTEANDWYGKNRVLTDGESRSLYEFLRKEKDCIYNCTAIKTMVAEAILDGEEIIVEADW